MQFWQEVHTILSDPAWNGMSGISAVLAVAFALMVAHYAQQRQPHYIRAIKK